ncbi:hypothetical protein HHK36_010383 [Tetracentron sinense]|uniref:non-specific serine/threonine protein kinase n=1 Tax=Tetracentron sinense TaxID=13715 RepID=A0A834ZET1_TETSI|nr:hypothetical protein HHK36_010383 [Tetracentron sinense]
MAMDDNESCSSRAMDSSPTHPRQQRQKLEIYNQVLLRLKDLNVEEANLPGFDDELWAHFNRLPARYALDVNAERAEDVLTHKRLLQLAHDPANRPAIEVRLVQVHPISNEDSVDSVHSNSSRIEDAQSSIFPSRHSIHPPPSFGSSPNLETLALEANKSHVQDGDSAVNGSPHFARPMHEITFSAYDKPKLLSQLTSLLSEIGLNIQEAHAFSTVDGYSLDVFVVDGWPYEETEQLRNALEKEMLTIELSVFTPTDAVFFVLFLLMFAEVMHAELWFVLVNWRPDELRSWSKRHSLSPTIEHGQTGMEPIPDHVKIPTDGTDVWEIDAMLLKFENKVASGSYGDLYKGTYCSQEVAIKVLKPERVNVDMQREFAQEVYIMRKVRHRNVVQFIGACTRPPSLCIVTEFMSGGSVYDYLHKQKGVFKLPSLLKVAIDVSKGMNYLHRNNIIHRDLKAANLLMDENECLIYPLLMLSVSKTFDFVEGDDKERVALKIVERGRGYAREIRLERLACWKLEKFISDCIASQVVSYRADNLPCSREFTIAIFILPDFCPSDVGEAVTVRPPPSGTDNPSKIQIHGRTEPVELFRPAPAALTEMVDGSDQPLSKSKVGEMSGALGEVGWRNKGKHRTALGRGWRVRKSLILKRKTGCRILIRASVGNSEDKGVEASGIKDQVLGPSGPEFCSPFGSPFLGSKGTGSGVGPVRPSPRSSPPLTNSGSGVGVGPVSLGLSSPKSADPFGLYPLLARTGLVVKGQDLHLEGKASVSRTGSRKVEELAGISGCASSLSAGSFVVKRLEDSRWFQSRSGSGSAGAVGSLLPGSSHGSQTRASGGDIGGQVLLEDGEFSRSLCGALALVPSGDSFSSPATGRVMPSMSGPRGLEGGGVGFDVRGLDSSVVSPEAGELVESTFMGVDSESRRLEVLAGVCSVGSSGMVGTSDTLEGRRSVPGETGLPTSSSAGRAGGLSPLSSGKSLRPASLRPNSFKGCSGFSGSGVGTSSGYPAVLPRACSGVVKVADFGVARVQAQSGVMTAETGTYRWMAPEVIEHKPYDHKADIFSFGIVLWELLTGKIPYEYLTPLQAAVGVVQKGLRPTIPKHTHPKLMELLEKCWQQDPTLRPEFSEIIEMLQQTAKEVGDEGEDRRKEKSSGGFLSVLRRGHH